MPRPLILSGKKDRKEEEGKMRRRRKGRKWERGRKRKRKERVQREKKVLEEEQEGSPSEISPRAKPGLRTPHSLLGHSSLRCKEP